MNGSPGRPHRGRRDNGLDAAEFIALADVDPRVGEHLLDVLGLAGIAAYLHPTTDTHPWIRATTLPNRPTDRLWVDRSHRARAEAFMTQLGPLGGPEESTRRESAPLDESDPPSAIDEAWTRIVTEYHSPAAEGAPAAEQVVKGDNRQDDPLVTSSAPGELIGDVPRAFEDSLRDSLEDEDRFTPPPPPPLPRLSRSAGLALLGILVGLILFIRPDLLGIEYSLARLIGAACILAGSIALILRLRDDFHDDDPDDGAVV